MLEVFSFEVLLQWPKEVEMANCEDWTVYCILSSLWKNCVGCILGSTEDRAGGMWLRHYATSWKVAGSSRNEVEFFQLT
jgi:hypothetical protein